ncbi:hypothetical protein NQ318_004437 [Aromia moschata]|uniref:DDE-1 domain-containing protein n=1 Tax=Aromia moschata TaxID=1265417 RepID=A0AAV8XPZ7_9CUCU|nr:hypothetical protein NQ318_004437 [Aromia moschata]
MVRKYQRTPGSKPYANFTKENMEKAVDAVREGMSQRAAAIKFNVPRISLLRRVVALQDVKSINLYNYDETNVTDDPGTKTVIVPRNTKRVERVQEHSRASISIMVCGNANGDLLPPMVVYKALNIYENWTQGCPVGTKYASSASGWFDMNLFETWFFSILLPHVEATREAGDTVVLLGDNLASHFSPKVIEACRTSKIYLSPFPANATNLM